MSKFKNVLYLLIFYNLMLMYRKFFKIMVFCTLIFILDFQEMSKSNMYKDVSKLLM